MRNKWFVQYDVFPMRAIFAVVVEGDDETQAKELFIEAFGSTSRIRSIQPYDSVKHKAFLEKLEDDLIGYENAHVSLNKEKTATIDDYVRSLIISRHESHESCQYVELDIDEAFELYLHLKKKFSLKGGS